MALPIPGTKTRAPYGTWISPITVDYLISDSVKLSDAIVDPITSKIYHLEGRPSEEGRGVLVKTQTGLSINDAPFNVRTSVHEYGGAAAIVHNDIAYFSNFEDGRVYRVRIPASGPVSEKPEPVTPLPDASQPGNPTYRFANFDVHPLYPHLLVSIFEDHTIDHPASVVNTLCVIDTKAKTFTTILKGADFYTSPVFSKGDGKYLAWQQWKHPDMPWQGGEVHVAQVVANVDSGEVKLEVKDDHHVAGEHKKISAGYPLWVNATTLAFLNDVSGYFNPWVYDVNTEQARPVLKQPDNYDYGGLLWYLNEAPHTLIGDRWGIYTVTKDGKNVLRIVDYTDNEKEPVEVQQNPGEGGEFVTMSYIKTVDRENGTVVFVGGQVGKETGITLGSIIRDPGTTSAKAKLETIYPSSKPKPEGKSDISLDTYISYPKPKTVGPPELPVHVVLYEPLNPNYEGSSIPDEKPPCVIYIHGGPSSITTQNLDWSKQFWTTRGWAWLDVNYGGSSGYGRAYLERLDGNWGIVDVNDSVAAAKALGSSESPLIDIERIAIRGGSAGGFTTLCALPAEDATGFQIATGASSYGVTDLLLLAGDTHKFESQYLFKLVGGTPEEVPEIYKDRSPVTMAQEGKFGQKPILVLQGEDDRVVPKAQADKFVEAIKAHQGQVEYKLYAGEGHGWRKAETIKDSIEREIEFYKKVFKIPGA